MKYYNYADKHGVIRIKASKKPSSSSVPKCGTWRVEELTNDLTWQRPLFPEVTWGSLNRLIFLGSTSIE